MGLLKAFLNLRVHFVILMVKGEKYKTENTNTTIHVPLHQNGFNILNLSYITSGLTLQVKTVSFNLKIVLNFLIFFELVLKLS